MNKFYFLLIIISLVGCTNSQVSVDEAQRIIDNHHQQKEERRYQENLVKVKSELREQTEWVSPFSDHKYARWLSEFDREHRINNMELVKNQRNGHSVIKIRGEILTTATVYSNAYPPDVCFIGNYPGAEHIIIFDEDKVQIPFNPSKEEFFDALLKSRLLK